MSILKLDYQGRAAYFGLRPLQKGPFLQQPEPKHRFSAVSLPQYLLILPKCPLNPPRTPHNWASGRLLGGNRHT